MYCVPITVLTYRCRFQYILNIESYGCKDNLDVCFYKRYYWPVKTDEPARRKPMENASVVIIGGGLLGASVAYQLARQGEQDIILLERFDLA